MTVEIISRSISMKVWDRARIILTIPNSAVGLATDRAMGPGPILTMKLHDWIDWQSENHSVNNSLII